MVLPPIYGLELLLGALFSSYNMPFSLRVGWVIVATFFH